MGNGGFRRMDGTRAGALERYEEYLAYIEQGEVDGTMSHDEWLSRNPRIVVGVCREDWERF